MANLKKNFKKAMREYEDDIIKRVESGEFVTPQERSTYDLVKKKRRENSPLSVLGKVVAGIAKIIFILGCAAYMIAQIDPDDSVVERSAKDSIKLNLSTPSVRREKKEVVEYIIKIKGKMNEIIDFHNSAMKQYNSGTMNNIQILREYEAFSGAVKNEMDFENEVYAGINENIAELINVEGNIINILAVPIRIENQKQFEVQIQKMNDLIEENKKLVEELLNERDIDFEIDDDGKIQMYY